MRELLFRGQQRRKGEKVRLDGSPLEGTWFYGSGVLQGKNRSIIYQSENGFDKHVVYTDTVGQYTGLTDKNGKKIFEGDIIKGKGKNVYVVEYSENIAGFVTEGFGILCRPAVNTGTMCYYTVIGNIYDNPELLGGGFE